LIKKIPSFMRKVTTKTLLEMKNRGEKIAMLTAYDFLIAKLLDESGIDVILVGDSLGNVFPRAYDHFTCDA
jgi:3-methyl-2-oxobutanoate hydroxymethyltransferase